MKNKIITLPIACTLALLGILLSFGSCQNLDIESQPERPNLLETDVLDKYTVLASIPTNIAFNISANEAWKVESDAQWCQVTPSMSSTSSLVAEVIIKVESNELEESRTAILTITSEALETPKKVEIVQNAKGKLDVQPIETSYAEDGEAKEFSVCSNYDWEVKSSSMWLELSVDGGKGNNEVIAVVATAQPNEGAVRKAVVTIKNALDTYTFEVTQKGATLEVIDATEENTMFAGAGSVQTYTVKTSIEWKAVVDDADKDWITLTQEEDKLTVETKASNRFGIRNAEIRISSKEPIDGLEDYLLAIKQRSRVSTEIGDGSSATYDDNGVITLTSTSGNRARVVMGEPFRLGTFIINFTKMDIPEGNGWFDINGYPNVSPSSANYHLWIGPSKHEMTCGGGFEWEQGAIDITKEDLDNLKQMKLVVDEDPDNSGKVRIALYMNDRLVCNLPNKTNVYADPAEEGVILYFGFDNGGTASSCTMESYEYIPSLLN